MANLLCQSAAYEDISILMDLCRAKWKICIRCVQELIQGKPNNILYVLRRKEFLRHVGCATIVEHLARSFMNTNNSSEGINLLRRENQNFVRPRNWGQYQDKDIPHISGQNRRSSMLLRVWRRNYIGCDTFHSDVGPDESGVYRLLRPADHPGLELRWQHHHLLVLRGNGAADFRPALQGRRPDLACDP